MRAPKRIIVLPSDKPRKRGVDAWLDFEEFGVWSEDFARVVPLAKIDIPEPWSEVKLRENVELMARTGKTRPVRLSMGPSGRYSISDGIHRCNAAIQLQYDAVPAIVTVERRTPPPAPDDKKELERLRAERAGWDLFQRIKREYNGPIDWGNVHDDGGFILVMERNDPNAEFKWKVKYALVPGGMEAQMSGAFTGTAQGSIQDVASQLARMMLVTTRNAMSIKRKISKITKWVRSICAMTKKASWRSEFGSDWAVPQEIDALVSSGQLEDSSWHNDTSPSFRRTTPEQDGSIKMLWVDHPDPDQREMYGTRFGVMLLDKEYNPLYEDHTLETDNLNEALTELMRPTSQQTGGMPVATRKEIEERLYDLQRKTVGENEPLDPTAQQEADSLLKEYQSLTGRSAPGFWTGKIPRRT